MNAANGRRVALSVLSAALMFAGTLVGTVAVAPIAAAAVPNEVADAAKAEQLARQSGKEIIIGSETTETTQVKANPDGTRTLTTYTHPVRVKQNGSWAAVDLTLEKKPDGSVAPKVAPVSMAFTSGGKDSRPTAKLTKDSAEVGFSWDGPLPEAKINGSTVTYPEVMPGVDLEVTAGLTGFSQNLVVKNTEAAKNPKLKKVKFKSHTKNTKINEADGLVVTGNDGKQVFGGDATKMYDSSPVESRQAVMDVEVAQDSIAVTPDQQFLTDPKTTYPVRIDPDYFCTTCSKVHHAVVQSPWPTARNYDVTSGQLGDLKAGYLNSGSLGSSTNGVSRTYFQMNVGQIVGKIIKGATLHAKVIHSYSCSPTPTELWHTGWIDGNTTWNNQPGWIRLLSENNQRNNAGYCPTDGGADFDAYAAVVDAAANNRNPLTFMFKAKHENSLDASWRRFDLNPYLEVKYNSAPNIPIDLGMEGWGPNGGDALPCAVGANRPVVGKVNPRLRARVSDPDGGLLRDSGFALYKGFAGNGTWFAEPVALDVPSGSYAEVTVPGDKVTEDGVYHWTVYAGDGEARGPLNGICEFAVDTVKPNTPAVSSTDYPATGFNGSVGRTGNFTLSPNGNTGTGGTMDVVRYGWSLNDVTFENRVDVTTADGVMTAPITPKQSGTNVLYVQAYDKAGNPAMASQRYVFNVADPTGPVGAWNFDETSGTTAADISGKGHPLTGVPSFGAGYANNGQANTATTFSQTSAPVVDTSRAFSVSAWVKLDKADWYYTVASQDGTRGSGFYLHYAYDVNRWVFTTTASDTDSPAIVRASSAGPPQVGVWTHLLGTYEPNSRKLSLYVNGKLEGTTETTNWNATGAFVVGAAKWNGNREHNVPGTIDHVQVWDRALSAAEAAKQNNFVVLRAHYNLDEQIGTTTKDEVSGTNGTLSGGITWSGTPADPDDPNQVLSSRDKWVKLDSSWTGQVAGQRPQNLRTDRSYTVSAWVRHAGPDAAARAAVGMGDTTHSPFLLGYRGETGKWGFLLTKTANGDGIYALSDQAAVANTWVHLAATYDATTGTVALFVNGVKQNTLGLTDKWSGHQTFNGSGDFWVGRGIWGGNRSDVWKGDVDDARIYSGVLSDQDIAQLRLATLHS